jgi:hypothetical protein
VGDRARIIRGVRYRRFAQWSRSVELRRPWLSSLIRGGCAALGTFVGIAIVQARESMPVWDQLTVWWVVFAFIFGCIGGRIAIQYRIRAMRRNAAGRRD